MWLQTKAIGAFLLLLSATTTRADETSNKTSNKNAEQEQDGLSMEYKPNTWYQKYKRYPEYCSTPLTMFQRKIPPLKEFDPYIGETRLLHATAVIRHGARTPYSSSEQCWDGYWTNPETGIWDCDLTTTMASPSPNEIKEEEQDYSMDGWQMDDAMFLFEKRYDALPYPQLGLTNELNGTCQVGQLLLQGYEQEIKNGQLLREAYSYKFDSYDHDERMRLVDLSFNTYAPWDPYHLRYRADDDQRTLMSGQVLLRGLFDEEVLNAYQESGIYPKIAVHTADRDRDIMDANTKVCPKLAVIKEAAEQSDAYQAFNKSEVVQEMRDFIAKELGRASPTQILDCLMTTMCTDRPLPAAIDDFGEGQSKFESLAEFDTQSYNMIMKYNDAEYAKLSMAPLWAEIWDNIRPWMLDSEDPYIYEDVIAPKLAIFSGHDTTLMPLLASLGPKLWNDTEWAPYASMLVIEVHELIDGRKDKDIYPTDFSFRLIFNGKILTHLVPGCPPEGELCDMTYLQDKVEAMATREPDCWAPEPVKPSEVIVQAKTLMRTTQGVFMFLGVVAFGAIVGGLACFVLLMGRFPFMEKKLFTSAVEDDEDARRGLQETGFEDEPSDEDDFVNGKE